MNNYKYLDVSSDYGACLWINGKAIDPKYLPISKNLLNRIEIFIEDYLFNALYKNEEYWDKHCLDEDNIAKQLQEELPDITVRIFAYNRWIEINKYLYRIDIIEGLKSGGNFTIFPIENALGIDGCYYRTKQDNKNHIITLDETFSFPFIFFFLKKYFDISIQNRKTELLTDDNGDEMDFTPDEVFYWWGCNYYSYDEIKIILKEIKKYSEYLISDFENPELDEFKEYLIDNHFDSLFIQRFYPNLQWEELTKDEQNDFIKAHSYILVDFYQRLGEHFEKMMSSSSDCKFICFAGP